jgi:prepilin-type N-terminal cleavage/methylation domain-containing protein
MKFNPRRGKAAFTLIELMAVITIIVILAGLVVGGMGFVTERQAKEKAKVQIALLSKALEEYKLDMGTYPATADITKLPTKPGGTGTSAILYNALFYDGFEFAKDPSRKDTTPPKASKIYLADLDPTSTKQGWVVTQTSGDPKTSLVINDPWGNQYCYRTALKADGTPNAATQNPDFDLWSMGKDGASRPATPADKNNNDDIKNF